MIDAQLIQRALPFIAGAQSCIHSWRIRPRLLPASGANAAIKRECNKSLARCLRSLIPQEQRKYQAR